MKLLFDIVSRKCAKSVTQSYSTSFASATKMLSPVIRQDIYNIYGFVRFADEIVDSFHDYDKPVLFKRFEDNLDNALLDKISLNPILNAFQETVHKYGIERHLIDAFMKSMRLDLTKSEYLTDEEFEKVFKMKRSDFLGLKEWRRVDKKKEAGLF